MQICAQTVDAMAVCVTRTCGARAERNRQAEPSLSVCASGGLAVDDSLSTIIATKLSCKCVLSIEAIRRDRTRQMCLSPLLPLDYCHSLGSISEVPMKRAPNSIATMIDRMSKLLHYLVDSKST